MLSICLGLWVRVMDFQEENVRLRLGKYKFRDLTVEDLKNVHKRYPNFIFSMDTYTFRDGSQKDLLNFVGTIPMTYQGNSYNIPVQLWILDSHPFAPPLCFLKPTATMGIHVGKHVDTQGRIYLPYLQNWSHPKSTVLGLFAEMILKFEEELPLYSLSSVDAARQQELLSYISKITDGVSSLDVNSAGRTGGRKNDGDTNKVTVIGGGDLGIACVLAIAAKGIADKVVLLDLAEGTSKGGGAMDLNIFNLPNMEISKVEIMTYVAWKLSGLPENQVIGIGCNLDSERFQYIIENILKAHISGKEAWIIGEQGENKVPAFDPASPHSSIQDQLVNRALEILKGKSQKSWSVGLSVADLTDSIVTNKRKIHSVSTLAKGTSGDVFLSMPCILGSSGVIEIIRTAPGQEADAEKLQNSATTIHGLQQQLKL
ncbi:ubiquitin-conjugating enzyme E2 variant 3 isoform X3 [Microcaecilia unicolor]|uniref:Ubiquitin-conjugating enzyme E2 variant 3 isoform X3 n=1 Tax=Microcaecilia unicolor TaxID=1415580 RepID=A0A6P7Y2A7_9AMPH|nr:ubiquitin-conjugating enzyme E2 variant 3 isoform X3 [Microcaecilia unicolor]